jgi:hypothetical protein
MKFRFLTRGLAAVGIVAVLVQTASPAGGQTKPQTTPPTPVVEAANVVGDFARDYDKASEKYTVDDIILQGRVDHVTVRKGTDGKTLASAVIVPREPGSGSMVPIIVAFGGPVADEAGKLKPGDLVQIETAYLPVPATRIFHEIRGFMGMKLKSMGPDPKPLKLREELVGWLKKSNALQPGPGGADNVLVKQMSGKVDASLAAGDDFTITFGPGLMLSGKATFLSVQDGKAFPVELTADQSAAMKIPEMSAVFAAFPSRVLRMPAEVEMTTPTIDGGGAWGLAKPLTGKVKIKELTGHFNNPGEYGVRLVCYKGDKRAVFFSPFHSRPVDGTYSIQFAALKWEIEGLMAAKQTGPSMAFFEVVRRIGPDRFEHDKPEPQYEVISEPAETILTLSAE